MVDDLNAKGSASIWAPYFYKADGTQITTPAVNQANDQDWGTLLDPLQNGATIKTDGLDISAAYRLSKWEDSYGVFTFYGNANVLLSYDYEDPYAGKFKYGGKYRDINTVDPGGQ